MLPYASEMGDILALTLVATNLVDVIIGILITPTKSFFGFFVCTFPIVTIINVIISS